MIDLKKNTPHCGTRLSLPRCGAYGGNVTIEILMIVLSRLKQFQEEFLPNVPLGLPLLRNSMIY